MTYIIDVPANNLTAIFGSAYPAIGLSGEQQCNFVRELVISAARGGPQPGYVAVSRRHSPGSKFRIEIMMCDAAADDDGYACAISAEEYFNTLPTSKISMVPKFLHCFLRRGYPIDSYRIEEDEAEVVTWLVENCNSNDYQIYSKLGYDFTIGFKNTEASTMFKLMFGDCC
jgi:hypothetical protein